MLHILGCFLVQTVSYIVLLIFSVRLATGKDATVEDPPPPMDGSGSGTAGGMVLVQALPVESRLHSSNC